MFSLNENKSNRKQFQRKYSFKDKFIQENNDKLTENDKIVEKKQIFSTNLKFFRRKSCCCNKCGIQSKKILKFNNMEIKNSQFTQINDLKDEIKKNDVDFKLNLFNLSYLKKMLFI